MRKILFLFPLYRFEKPLLNHSSTIVEKERNRTVCILRQSSSRCYLPKPQSGWKGQGLRIMMDKIQVKGACSRY
jgi:hypothetical protein